MESNHVCAVCGKSNSETRVRYCTLYGDYLCTRHNFQFRKYGFILKRTKRDPNEFIIQGNICKIALYDKENQFLDYAIIDAEDAEKCKQHKWKMVRSNKTCYAATHITSNKNLSLHRFILNYQGSQEVDHINRNGLDNRKINLRIVDGTTNNLNKSSKGVKKAYGGYYIARFRADGVDYILGYYKTESEASIVSELCRLQYIEDKEYFIQSYNLVKMLDSELNPDRNIIQTPSGSYAVRYGYGKRLYYVGTYHTIEEARAQRDAFEKQRNEYPEGKEVFDLNFFAEKERLKTYSGISQTSSGRWRVNGRLNGRGVYVGTYDTIEEALEAKRKTQEENAIYKALKKK